jgi:uncharacterized protein DUF2628
MAIYTVHEPPLKRDETEPDPERFAFVRDGFAFWAFLLAPLWMLRHRLWLVFVGYVLLTIVLQVVLRALGVSTTVMAVVGFLVALLIGFEAASLRRFSLTRRGWRNVGIVSGDDLEAAERRFFDAWVSGPAPVTVSRAAPLPTSSVPIIRRVPSDVIGLFPEPGAPR